MWLNWKRTNFVDLFLYVLIKDLVQMSFKRIVGKFQTLV